MRYKVTAQRRSTKEMRTFEKEVSSLDELFSKADRAGWSILQHERIEKPLDKAMRQIKETDIHGLIHRHEWKLDMSSIFIKKDYYSCSICGVKQEEVNG